MFQGLDRVILFSLYCVVCWVAPPLWLCSFPARPTSVIFPPGLLAKQKYTLYTHWLILFFIVSSVQTLNCLPWPCLSVQPSYRDSSASPPSPSCCHLKLANGYLSYSCQLQAQISSKLLMFTSLGNPYLITCQGSRRKSQAPNCAHLHLKAPVPSLKCHLVSDTAGTVFNPETQVALSAYFV